MDVDQGVGAEADSGEAAAAAAACASKRRRTRGHQCAVYSLGADRGPFPPRRIGSLSSIFRGYLRANKCRKWNMATGMSST